MKFIYSGFLIYVLVFIASPTSAQTNLTSKTDSVFATNGEIYFKFSMSDKERVDSLSSIISIDKYMNGEVHAYARRDQFFEFLKLHISYILIPQLGPQVLNEGDAHKTPQNMTLWNFYPTYNQYLTFMSGFASTYPSICKVDTIGTTPNGHLLLAVKISDSVNYERGVPQVLFTSSIHGDEVTGYVLMMHLIDTLLNAYGNSTRITNLIHNTQIFINPLANPDGTFYSGDGTITNNHRTNQFNVDMNRNYPDPRVGQHPDGLIWQPETEAFMSYADHHRFSMSMNFHGGSEVVNYPWDSWVSSTKVTADNSWWQFVSHEYADTAKKNAPARYFTDVTSNGISEGGDWYVISGGRQDYHNYFKHDREVTIEISAIKHVMTPDSMLTYWKWNNHCFLNYIEQATYGINGKVYDSITGSPIAAKVLTYNGTTLHDVDSSYVYSTLPTGWYFRPIDTGPWNLRFSAPGYYPRTVSNVSSTRRITNRLNVKLRPVDVNWPRCFLAAAKSGNEIDLSWGKNGNGNPVMIAASTTNTFGTPANGTAYTVGTLLAGGGTIIYNNGLKTFAHTLLDPNTTWYYRAWSVGTGNIYSTSASASTTTLCGAFSSFPFTESFTTATTQMPNCWSQEATGDNTAYSNPWVRSNTNIAGGVAAWEMRLPRNSSVTSGTIRLKTFSFNTVGVSTLNLTFRNYVDGRNPGLGATLKVQSSSDGITWTDEWSLPTVNGNIAASTVTVSIAHNLGSTSTMLAFTATGNLSIFDFWYIDDVVIKAPGYWVGGTAGSLTDWNTTTNWGDGVIPITTTNVYIPQRTYLPVISPTSANCNNLTIAPNSKITVGSGRQITVGGKMTLQGP